jgi:8-oxo-dGTP diphosphatase
MIVEVVAGLIRDRDDRVLAVRKKGTAIYMLPGGKREPGEGDIEALTRELAEELGVRLTSAEKLGTFQALAANEPGAKVRSDVYRVTVEGRPTPGAEIADMLWIEPGDPGEAPLAPLLRDHVLPRL